MQHPRSVTFSKMSRLLTCPMASVVLLTALLLAAGSVVCGSPTDQDWFNHDPTWSWTDCCECIIVMYFDSNKIIILAPPDSPLVLNKSSIMIQPVPLKVDHVWNISFLFENS